MGREARGRKEWAGRQGGVKDGWVGEGADFRMGGEASGAD